MTAPAGVTWGVGCWQTHVLADLVADVRAAEDGGFDYVWYGNEKLHADMWLGLAAVALNSTAARVGTFVADPYSIHPAVTAAMKGVVALMGQRFSHNLLTHLGARTV